MCQSHGFFFSILILRILYHIGCHLLGASKTACSCYHRGNQDFWCSVMTQPDSVFVLWFLSAVQQGYSLWEPCWHEGTTGELPDILSSLWPDWIRPEVVAARNICIFVQGCFQDLIISVSYSRTFAGPATLLIPVRSHSGLFLMYYKT